MAKCIYDCARCELDVDKILCCQFQTLRLLADLNRTLKEPAEKPSKKRTIADIASETPKNE